MNIGDVIELRVQSITPSHLLTGSELGASRRVHLMGASPDKRLDDLDFCMTTAFVNVSYNS